MHILLLMVMCLVLPVWIVNSDHQRVFPKQRFRGRPSHIYQDITNLTLKFLHQKTATTNTPTTSRPRRKIKGLIVRLEEDIMIIKICQYYKFQNTPSWFYRYFCVRDFRPIW